MFYEPILGHGLPHDPFKAIIAPRPIGWISTLDARGAPNLAPYSFFNGVCSDPPMVMFSSEGRKDTVNNVEATGEFVCSLATHALKDAMNATSAPVGPETDEFTLAKLEPAASRTVRPPRVASSPAALECKMVSVTELKDLHGAATNRFVVIGQVLGVHIDEAYLVDGLFDTAKAHALSRCGYMDYSTVFETFTLKRPA